MTVALLAASFAWLAGGTMAAPGADWTRLQATVLSQASVARPDPFGEAASAGPWRIEALEVVTGGEATDLVLGASERNAAPAEGFQYVAVRLSVTNVAARAYRIDFNDFGVAGEDGIVRRFAGAIAPEPALDATVAPGETTEGWIVAAARAAERDLILLYDSASIHSGWADAALALEQGASYASAQGRAMPLNRIGRDPEQPAGIGTAVATREWAVELVRVVFGADVLGLFPQGDFRTRALESSVPGASATWMAFQVRITNNATGDQPAHFPASAFTLADGQGNPIPDVLTLSAPAPDAAGEYLPGATREGWVVFDVPPDYGGSLLRLLPYRTDDDPRYLTWGAGGVQAPVEPVFEGTLEEGSSVRLIEDQVNMRAAPSTGADVVEVLAVGTELTVTGPPEEGAGFVWYPVRDLESGRAGYVAQQFLEPVD